MSGDAAVNFDFDRIALGDAIMRARIRLTLRERLVELWHSPRFWEAQPWPGRGWRDETDAELRARMFDKYLHPRIEMTKIVCIFKGESNAG